jgi:hypothetical protein
MKKVFLILSLCLFCISCGVKNDPEYNSQKYNNIDIRLI